MGGRTIRAEVIAALLLGAQPAEAGRIFATTIASGIARVLRRQ